MMQFDVGLDIPPLRPEPLPDLHSPCVGGPWDGATITHRPEDTRDRDLDTGRYVWDDSGYWTWYAHGL